MLQAIDQINPHFAIKSSSKVKPVSKKRQALGDKYYALNNLS